MAAEGIRWQSTTKNLKLETGNWKLEKGVKVMRAQGLKGGKPPAEYRHPLSKRERFFKCECWRFAGVRATVA